KNSWGSFAQWWDQSLVVFARDEYTPLLDISGFLGRVDKRDSHRGAGMIQAGICYGDQLGTRPDVGRGMGVL
ncbi:MAG: hypothetical protein P8X51_19645, partial [Maritimibacter sp.]